MKVTFPHVVSVITGGLAAVVQFTPVLAAVPAVAPYGALIVAAAGALVNVGHAFLAEHPDTPAPAAPPAQKGFARVGMLVAVAAVALAGCASVSSFFSSPTGNTVVIAAVDVAVATAEQKGVPAAQINKVAKAALAADSGVNGTLSALSALVDEAIAKANLPAGDLAAAKILEVAVGAAIQDRLQGNKDLAATQAAVAQVLVAVIAASGG